MSLFSSASSSTQESSDDGAASDTASTLRGLELSPTELDTSWGKVGRPSRGGAGAGLEATTSWASPLHGHNHDNQLHSPPLLDDSAGLCSTGTGALSSRGLVLRSSIASRCSGQVSCRNHQWRKEILVAIKCTILTWRNKNLGKT